MDVWELTIRRGGLDGPTITLVLADNSDQAMRELVHPTQVISIRNLGRLLLSREAFAKLPIAMYWAGALPQADVDDIVAQMFRDLEAADGKAYDAQIARRELPGSTAEILRKQHG